MTLSELRQRWHEIKDRPLWDRERSDIESALFAEFDKACKVKPVYNQKICSEAIASRYANRQANTNDKKYNRTQGRK